MIAHNGGDKLVIIEDRTVKSAIPHSISGLWDVILGHSSQNTSKSLNFGEVFQLCR